MNGVWSALADGQAAAIAASGSVNAIYFGRHAVCSTGGRRLAAGVLMLLFAGVALDAAAVLAGLTDVAAEAARRTPLLVATLATSMLLRLGAGR